MADHDPRTGIFHGRAMTGMQEQWQKISENLRGVLNPGIFKVWIHPLDAHIEGNSLCLAAPSEYVARWLRDRMQDTLRSAAAPVLQVAPENIDIRISCQGAAPAPAAPAAPAAVAAAPLAAPVAQPVHEAPATPLHTAPSRPSQPLWQPSQCSLPLPAPTLRPRTRQRWRFSFDDFVVGPCNAMAVAAAKDICHDGGCVETLFVSSASGLGKTHIMQSVGRAVQEQGGQARLASLSAEDLASRYVAALRSNDVESFRARLRDLDVLLLEDVHFLQGKEKMQDMVLTVIKSLQDRGGRAIFTSSFSPRELEKLDSQLVSHFCSGIVSPLERPDTEMCRHILERKAKSFQVLLPDEVCDLLAGRLQGDVRQLESCLKSLVFKARMLNCGLNPELALEVLQQYATVDCGPDFASIVRLVCESYGLNERQLASRSHKQQYVLARNTIYYLARKHTDMSLKEIGERFNRRHSTVIKGITSLEREIANESRVGRQISRAVELIERNAGIRPEMSLAGKVPAARHAAPSLLSL